jgi:hypothetical protein
MIAKEDKNMVPLEAKLKAAPELKVKRSCRKVPRICFGCADRQFRAKVLVE